MISLSHPSWMRGLKLERGETEMRKTRSHPSRMRGLKHNDISPLALDNCRIPCGCVD